MKSDKSFPFTYVEKKPFAIQLIKIFFVGDIRESLHTRLEKTFSFVQLYEKNSNPIRWRLFCAHGCENRGFRLKSARN